MAKFEKMEIDPMFQVNDQVHGEIWNRVCQCELFGEEMENFLKEVTYGTRHYTAIDAYQQIKKATEIFGPFGAGWGIKSIDVISTIPTFKKTRDEIIEGTQLFVKITMFYVWNDQFHSVPLMQDVFVDSSGDCGKKMMTDCITKFLSYLGFNFDVFQGRFDGNKVLGTRATAEEEMQLKALLLEVMGEEKAKGAIDYHERRGFKKADVTSDIKKLLVKKAKKEANASQDSA